MKLNNYLSSKLLNISIYIIMCILIFFLLYAINISNIIIIIIEMIILLTGLIILFINFFNKYKFYNNLLKSTNNITEKFLVLETIDVPTNYEDKIIYDVLCEINKSMIDNINSYKNQLIDYKEFLEIWIHEVKIPISSMILLYHNHKDKYNNKMSSILKVLDNNIDEILYYVRSEDTEKDFMISDVLLKNVIKNISIKNKDNFLENNINFEVDIDDSIISTDKKWLEFIINQIINNSIKYKKKNNSIIKILSYEKDNKVYLEIYDNGIGISESDITRVFDKSFTGINGRDKVKSTGMGLYIVKNLCNKLGHSIKIESKINEYTKVIIIFGKNDLYKI